MSTPSPHAGEGRAGFARCFLPFGFYLSPSRIPFLTLKYVADAQWPAGVPGNAAIRGEFQIPPDKALA
jgi:hypothetical protein